MARRKTSLLKSKFGFLVVIAEAPNVNETVYWMCRCTKCGTVKAIARTNLIKGQTQCSCGKVDNGRKMLSTTKPAYKDGRSSHPLYFIWKGIIDRCTNEYNNGWKYYGKRGITVCNRWLNF